MIDIRKARGAKVGLENLCKYIDTNSNKDIKKMTLVEVGSFAGNSTEIFCKYFGSIICIDPWKPGWDENDGFSNYDMDIVEKQFRERVLNKYKKVVQLKMTSLEGANSINNNSIDVVYVDGNHQHRAVKEDLYAWWDKVKRGGFIGGHDYNNPPHYGVKKAIEEFLDGKKVDKIFEDTSWILQKK